MVFLFVFFFFWLHGRLSKAIFKNCCFCNYLFRCSRNGETGWDFLFSCVQGVGMKTRIFKLEISLDIN